MDSDDGETKNEPHWTYEKRVETLHDTRLAMETSRNTCAELKKTCQQKLIF